MTGGANLVDPQQHGVTIAIEPSLMDVLGVPRGETLDPQLASTARPVGCLPGTQGQVQRLVVHPGLHQHRTGAGILGNRGEQAVGIAFESGSQVGVEHGIESSGRTQPSRLGDHADGNTRCLVHADPGTGAGILNRAHNVGSSVMADRVVLIGGHGKIALLAEPLLVQAGFEVDALVRNPDQSDEVAATGARPVVLDVETADQDQLAEVFSGAAAIIWSAGAGGGSPERTRRVDHDAAVRAMRAAEQAGVARFVMVSYVRADVDITTLDPSDGFYAYARAKHDADVALRATSLDYTILGPGRLTDGSSTGGLTVADADGLVDGQQSEATTSRALVAEVLVQVLVTGLARRSTLRFFDGSTPIQQVLADSTVD